MSCVKQLDADGGGGGEHTKEAAGKIFVLDDMKNITRYKVFFT